MNFEKRNIFFDSILRKFNHTKMFCAVFLCTQIYYGNFAVFLNEMCYGVWGASLEIDVVHVRCATYIHAVLLPFVSLYIKSYILYTRVVK